MAEDSRDIIMKLEMSGGSYVPAECSAILPSTHDDKLIDGFQMGRGSQPPNYFSIEDFELSVSISGKNEGATDNATMDRKMREQVGDLGKQVNRVMGSLHDGMTNLHQGVSSLQDLMKTLHDRVYDLEDHVFRGRPPRGRSNQSNASISGLMGPPRGVGAAASGANSSEYERFLMHGRAAFRGGAGAYPSDLDSVSITKRMDRSSTTLFDCARKSFKFKSASIVKRKAVGTGSLRAYLRMDFTDVMITDFNWDDDEVIKETFKFVCRKAKVTYAQETLNTDKSIKQSAVLRPQPSAQWSVLPPGS